MNIKPTITAALLFASLTANASGIWTDLGGGVYYDHRSLIKQKTSVIAWAMFDITEPTETSPHSYKVIKFINCKKWTTGSSYHVFYAGYKGQGKVMSQGNIIMPMTPIVPDSNGEALAIEICGNK